MSRLDTFIRFPLAAAMLAAMTTVTGGGCSSRRAHDENARPIVFEEMPQAAQDAVRKEAGDVKLSSITTSGVTDTNPFYTVDTVKDGRQMHMQVDKLGRVAWVETEIEIEELPPMVKRTAVAETLGYPSRSFAKKVNHGKTTYLVAAATKLRGKVIEIDETGRIIHRELKSA